MATPCERPAAASPYCVTRKPHITPVGHSCGPVTCVTVAAPRRSRRCCASRARSHVDPSRRRGRARGACNAPHRSTIWRGRRAGRSGKCLPSRGSGTRRRNSRKSEFLAKHRAACLGRIDRQRRFRASVQSDPDLWLAEEHCIYSVHSGRWWSSRTGTLGTRQRDASWSFSLQG